MDDIKKQPEKMNDFFDTRADSYDNHMKTNINNFKTFYKNISEPILKTDKKIKILDLGCGTGLELESIFKKAPNASVTGVDVSKKMLEVLIDKYKDKAEQINIIENSYLEMDFRINEYDYVVSVMTVHHLLYDTKKKLYKKIFNSLKNKGKYIEGDYIVSKCVEEKLLKEYKLKTEENNNLNDGNFHIDIPFSVKTEKQLFYEVGFKNFDLVFEENEAAIYVVEK